MDYYELLEVSKNASKDEIKAACNVYNDNGEIIKIKGLE